MIDHDALADALPHGRLAAAILDVFDTEPLPRTTPCGARRNVFVTSHTAALSVPRRHRARCSSTITDVLSGVSL